MNYVLHYDRLIARARTRVLIGYRERHHVLPRCMGGSNAKYNIVELTAEEHYVAHQLLVKIHPGIGALAIAAVWMSKQCVGNKAYGWLRRRAANAMRGRKLPPRSAEWARKIALANRGKKASPEARAKMSAARRGNKYALGKVPSIETRALMSAARLGRKRSPEAIAKGAAKIRGRSRPDLAERNRTAPRSEKGRAASRENQKKLAVMRRGKPGKKPSEETRRKQSAARKGRKMSDETKRRLSLALFAHFQRKRAEYPELAP